MATARNASRSRRAIAARRDGGGVWAVTKGDVGTTALVRSACSPMPASADHQPTDDEAHDLPSAWRPRAGRARSPVDVQMHVVGTPCCVGVFRACRPSRAALTVHRDQPFPQAPRVDVASSSGLAAASGSGGRSRTGRFASRPARACLFLRLATYRGDSARRGGWQCCQSATNRTRLPGAVAKCLILVGAPGLEPGTR